MGVSNRYNPSRLQDKQSDAQEDILGRGEWSAIGKELECDNTDTDFQSPLPL